MIWLNYCIAVINLAAAPPEVFLHWQLYLMVSSFFFLSPTHLFRPSFTVRSLWVSPSLRNLGFVEKSSLGVSPKFLHDSVGNSYRKKDYIKYEVNVVEITWIRLQKTRKNVAMASFYCLVSKIWKTSILYCYKKEKNAWLVLLLKRKE